MYLVNLEIDYLKVEICKKKPSFEGHQIIQQ